MELLKKFLEQLKKLILGIEAEMGAEKPVTPPPSTGARLAIIVGHEKNASGATGYFPNGSKSEYKFYNEDVVPFMIDEAKKLGVEYKVFLRDGLGISGVGAAVSAWANSKTVAIELHFNSYNGSVKGSEVLYDTYPLGNKTYAEKIQGAMVRILGRSGTTDRKIKLTDSGRGSHNLTSVKCIGCLVEPAFCDNKEDAALLWNKREELAREFVRIMAAN